MCAAPGRGGSARPRGPDYMPAAMNHTPVPIVPRLTSLFRQLPARSLLALTCAATGIACNGSCAGGSSGPKPVGERTLDPKVNATDAGPVSQLWKMKGTYDLPSLPLPPGL